MRSTLHFSAISILLFTAASVSMAAPTFKRLQLTDKFYAEGAAAGDFNKDGQGDVISGPYWYAGPEFKERTAIYDTKDYKPKGYSRNFNTWAHDINGDGWDDVLRVTFPGDAALWYQNPGDGGKGEWKEHRAVDVVENESPQFADLTGDGQPDLVFSIAGKFVYADFDKSHPGEKWKVHPISGDGATGGKFTHGLGVGDVDGDGRMDLLEKGRWWKQPDSLAGDPLWTGHRFQFSGPGGADMFAYDFDGDGDNDIYTSAAAHGYGLTWFEQIKEKDKVSWKRHVITGKSADENPFGVVFSQAHSAQLVDMDGDGIKDLITGKRWWAHNGNDPGGNEPAVLYWFKLERGGTSGSAKFVPHQIDNDSGVGTQFIVKDLNNDKRPDIIVGNKKGTFVHLQVSEQKEPATGASNELDLLRDGDRVVLIGNTFIEREGNYGHIETALTLGASAAGKRITFRNLGWSGDTVFGHARSYFGPPEEGFQRLKAHLEMLKPTVIVSCYGAVAAYEGEKGKADFIAGYKRLLEMAGAASGGARFVLMSPPPCETLGAPLPDMAPQNLRLASYRDSIRKLADTEGHSFVDLFAELGSGNAQRRVPWTDAGIHFTDAGYRSLAPVVAGLFSLQVPEQKSDAGAELRKLIQAKNRLFFHRWRPQNETYLHGFRKHEQGNNAVEIPQFDPLVEAKEEAIHEFAGRLSKATLP